MDDQVRAAISHNRSMNRHNPEFHADPNDMTDAGLIEMVRDWTGMSQKFDQNGSSVHAGADKTVGIHVPLNEAKCQFVYDMIDVLGSRLGLFR
jgi:Family of unknown function (DUF5662)